MKLFCHDSSHQPLNLRTAPMDIARHAGCFPKAQIGNKQRSQQQTLNPNPTCTCLGIKADKRGAHWRPESGQTCKFSPSGAPVHSQILPTFITCMSPCYHRIYDTCDSCVKLVFRRRSCIWFNESLLRLLGPLRVLASDQDASNQME